MSSRRFLVEGRSSRRAPLDRPRRLEVLGVAFDLLDSEELRAWTREVLTGPRARHRIAFSNPEFVLQARRDERLRRYLNTCSLNLIDGVGIVAALRRIHGVRAPERLTGTAFVPLLCAEAATTGAKLFLVGGRPGVGQRAAAALKAKVPGVVISGVVDGFGGLDGAVEAIRKGDADVVMVCLGNPRQEHWIDEHLASLDVKLVFGNGGALDFWSADVRHAPPAVRRVGLEWLFRLVTNFSTARLARQLRLIEFVWLIVRAPRRRSRADPG
jgi:N-acetylglucosaminyldiphosphoundecaprenol N-acetyl-beta-D-mannosaminyltransferase